MWHIEDLRIIILLNFCINLISTLSYDPYTNDYFSTQNSFPQKSSIFDSPFIPNNFYDDPRLNNFPSIKRPFTNTHPNRCGVLVAKCSKSRYRTIDGSCNNLKHPSWGSTNRTYARLLPPKYGDGISTPIDVEQYLPLPREISLTLFPDADIKHHEFTLAAMQFGQIITHDMSLASGTTQINKHRVQCCTSDGQIISPRNSDYHCYPIIIPKNDPVFQGISCQNFIRTTTNRDNDCVSPSTPADQLIAVTSYLDASIVYGSSKEQARQVRAFSGGRLRYVEKIGRMFPPDVSNKSSCDISHKSEPCYLAGDVRVNQNPQLTLLQVIMFREHNRLAEILQHINPHWSDETIYQEARRILIAQHQHITYYEWLPLFIGLDNALKHKIIYKEPLEGNYLGYITDYNEHINPEVLNEHATAAFRYFHSAIAGDLKFLGKHLEKEGSIRLSDWFNRPVILEENSNWDYLIRSLSGQLMYEVDQFHESEITQFLFKGNRTFGQDLKTIDVQRNRDHGLASYNDYRHFCGLSRAKTFDDLIDVTSQSVIEQFKSLYKDVDDIDLTIGAFFESHVPGTLAGPTFLCILTEQFYRTRTGDRFFYENGNSESAFTVEQLAEIRKSSISRWFCDHGDHIEYMQKNGFVKPSEENPLFPCDQIPQIDLKYWTDISKQH